jgi:hypothetical protein
MQDNQGDHIVIWNWLFDEHDREVPKFSGFMLFRFEWLKILKERIKLTAQEKRSLSERSKASKNEIISYRWQQLPEPQKKEYVTRAKEINEKALEEGIDEELVLYDVIPQYELWKLVIQLYEGIELAVLNGRLFTDQFNIQCNGKDADSIVTCLKRFFHTDIRLASELDERSGCLTIYAEWDTFDNVQHFYRTMFVSSLSRHLFDDLVIRILYKAFLKVRKPVPRFSGTILSFSMYMGARFNYNTKIIRLIEHRLRARLPPCMHVEVKVQAEEDVVVMVSW